MIFLKVLRATPSLLLVVLVLLVAPAMVLGQSSNTRSDTGRHKPKPKPVVKAPQAPSTFQSSWSVGVTGGFQGGGDLWHLETQSGSAVPWVSDVPFTSSRFNASLETNFGLGVFVERRMGSMWSLRADYTSSRMDVAAEALQGQQGAVFLYDRLTVSTAGLAAEVRLARLESYPYLSAGLVWNRVSAAREDHLDQNQLGGRLGLGYLRVLGPDHCLRAEARLSRSVFDVGSFLPQSSNDNQPEIEFDPTDSLSIFEVIIGLQYNIP